jgi:hypothetical protein
MVSSRGVGTCSLAENGHLRVKKVVMEKSFDWIIARLGCFQLN